ncbi:hypothetical protein NQ315_005123, partial [Exocentrus adspersus]
EGGEEGSPEEGDKLEGEEDTGSMTPTSAVSPAPPEDEASSPTPGDVLSPPSPRSANEDARNLNSRCESRESNESTVQPQSPSAESLMSERAALLRGIPLGTSLSPVGVALPPTIPAAAAAALLPPQSAAMAAYLNAAAAAAVAQQSHRLMMTSPLPSTFNRASISPLISSSSSPPGGFNHSPVEQPLQSPPAEGILDFSKRGHKSEAGDSDSDVVNFSKPESPPSGDVVGAPLDLSVSSRKRTSDDPLTQPPQRKARTDFKPALPQWPPPIGASHLPYFAAAVAAAGLSPKNNSSELWNGKLKHVAPAPSDATKALEKMSELSKLGGEDLFRSMASAAPGNSASNRHSAWQSHWLNKGAEQAKDVLKCVWCKQSFPSLAAMTTHMKEAKHCGVNVPVPPMQSTNLIPQPQISSPSNTNTSTSSTNSTKPNQSDLNMLIKETMPLPRKLVRGQDVWLGKGAEQTRQILKCMWCGQSFRSLAEMTSHMQQTQHYTNIISQEQIISWRSTDDSKGGGGGGGSSGPNPPPGGASSHVSAVLTCKVCDQAFTSLKELSNHMVKNSHYKEHIMRSITESGGRRRQTREKRKKSLPVRKLLELERAQHEFKNGDSAGIIEKMRDPSGAGRITCEKCGNKIETSLFVDHIRQCVGGMTNNQRNFLKNALMSNNILPPETPNRDKLKTPTDKSPSPQQRSPSVSDLSTKEPSGASENNTGSSPSVLNAIEKLIEKSFDSRSRQNPGFPGHGPAQAPMGSSILKRLGIDESVDYTKPLVDAQTMNLLRSYHQHQSHHFTRRERSGSESSSISERGSSRVDSLTPERKMEPPGMPISSTPRSTPDIKREKSPFIEKMNNMCEAESNEQVVVKKEVDDDEHHNDVKVKREVEENDEDDRGSFHSNGDISKEEEEKRRSPVTSPRQHAVNADNAQPNSPCRNSSSSPASSDRSGTPRSTNGDRKSAGGSLGALSSMFDSLSGANNSTGDTNQAGNKKGSSHPLAALQKLCDKTETHTNNRSHASATATVVNPVSTSSTTTASGTTPGAILAFSWACNDAVMTSDSIMKCAFCDTPFISKGAYRHHLSKMHFVKDGVIPDPVSLKTPQPSSSANSGIPLKGTAIVPTVSSSAASTGAKSPPVPGGFEESPHSKFLKYTELAKQLSSKYV